MELLLQVPFFFVALSAFIWRRNFIRIPVIVYGAHTATTLVPILAELFEMRGVTSTQRALIVAIYAPYLIMPLLMLWRAWSREEIMCAPAAVAASRGKPKGKAH